MRKYLERNMSSKYNTSPCSLKTIVFSAVLTSPRSSITGPNLFSTCPQTLSALCWMSCPLFNHYYQQGDFPLLLKKVDCHPTRWMMSIVLHFCEAIVASTQKFDTSPWNFVYIRAWFWSEYSFQKYAVSFIWQNNMHCVCVHCLNSPFHLW